VHVRSRAPSGTNLGPDLFAFDIEDITKHLFGAFAHEHVRFHCPLAPGAAAHQRYLPV
jgi:hypothetical protein